MRINWNKLNPLAWFRRNTMFPGRPDYIGPTRGVFGLLHHQDIWEDSDDVMERVRYVKQFKDPTEVPVRLHNMIYLGRCNAALKLKNLNERFRAEMKQADLEISKEIEANRNKWDLQPDTPDNRAARKQAIHEIWDRENETSRKRSRALQAATAPLEKEVEAYVRKYIPDTTWNGTELVFPAKPAPQTFTEQYIGYPK